MKTCSIIVATLAALAAPAFGQTENPAQQLQNKAKEAVHTVTQEVNKAVNNAQPEGENPMDAWKKFNQPGKEHLFLTKNMVGEWTCNTKFWMAPNTDAVSSTATARFSPAMNGRFVMQEHNGEFMGNKFRGLGFCGYNNGAKCFESFWIDNESTLMLMSTGTQQADGSIEWKGTYTDPMSGEKKTSRSVTRFPADNTIVYEMYDNTSDGTEFKSLEVTYTRIANSKTTNIQTDATPVTDPHTPATGK